MNGSYRMAVSGRGYYEVELSVRQCQRLLRSLGFSLVRPQTFPSKGEENEQERTEYKKAQRPSI